MRLFTICKGMNKSWVLIELRGHSKHDIMVVKVMNFLFDLCQIKTKIGAFMSGNWVLKLMEEKALK